MGGDAAFDAVCQKWNWAKQEQAAMAKTVEQCKIAVEKMLLSKKVTERKTDSYEVKTNMISREFCSKKDMPHNVWSQYSHVTTFSRLDLKSLRSAATKAKASAKVEATKLKGGKKSDDQSEW